MEFLATLILWSSSICYIFKGVGGGWNGISCYSFGTIHNNILKNTADLKQMSTEEQKTEHPSDHVPIK